MLLSNSSAMLVEMSAVGLIISIAAAIAGHVVFCSLYLLPSHNESLFYCQALMLVQVLLLQLLWAVYFEPI